jgi:ankyrin repeat protein
MLKVLREQNHMALPSQTDINDFCYAAGDHRDDGKLFRLYARYGDAILNACHQPGNIPAVFYAANYGHADLMKWFIAEGARLDGVDERGETILMSAAWWTGKPDVVKMLLEKGADIDAVNRNGETARQIAEQNNQPEIVALIDQFRAGRESAKLVSDGLSHPVPSLKPLKFK